MLKKIKTLPVILRLAAAVLAIVAFCMMFAQQLAYVTTVGSLTDVKQLPIFADDAHVTVGGVVVGYILILVGGLVPAVTALVLDKKKKMIDLIAVAVAVVIVVVGLILVFNTIPMYKAANDIDLSGSALGATAEYKLQAGPIVGGISAIVVALANAASVVLPMIKK